MARCDGREIVRHLEEWEKEYGFPCMVSDEEVGGPCWRPPVLAVYGVKFCETHGAEAADGALEELHVNADEFFRQFEDAYTPNPLVRRVGRLWGNALPEQEQYSFSSEDTEIALRTAFPFRADMVGMDLAAELADPIAGNPHSLDSCLDERFAMHAVMRVAFQHGLDWVVDKLEKHRQHVAAQTAYAFALSGGESPKSWRRRAR
jgi:hypothetical protein